MEAFSLLKYWRSNGGGAPASASYDGRATTIVATVGSDDVESDGECNDDGPFFDLQFAVPDEEEEELGHVSDDNVSTCAENGEEEEAGESDGGGTDGEGEFNFTLSSGSDQNLSLSPSDDLFFKGRLVPVEPSDASETNSAKPPQFPVSLLKSATKFRVMMLGFKKSKQSVTEKTEPARSASPKPPPPPQVAEGKEKKLFTVKFKVEEVPIMSLFTRDNSTARSSSAKKAPPPVTQKQSVAAATSDELASSDEKLFSKEAMQKYLKKVKPLYVRVSRRYGDKLRFSGQLSLDHGVAKPPMALPAAEAPTPVKLPPPSTETKPEATASVTVKSLKQGNIPAGLRVVCKHLGKSRSASAVAAPPPPAISKRRDDSLLQQQDGIQSAILHCKRSFNASRDSESCAVSESAKEKPTHDSDDQSRKSFKDGVA